MAAKLDAKKIGVVFQGRPDIIANIKQAAGTVFHRPQALLEVIPGHLWLAGILRAHYFHANS
jgi:hypothetical protein